MNRVILMGRLTRDPDVRYSQGDNSMAIARYTLAVDRRRTSRTAQTPDQATADFISCVTFGKSAEFAEKYLHKGTKICVSGRIQTGSYTNKDGQKVYTTDVVVEDQEFAESRNSQGAGGDFGGWQGGSGFGAPEQSFGQQSYQSAGGFGGASAPAREQPSGAIDGFMNIPDGIDEELPFS